MPTNTWVRRLLSALCACAAPLSAMAQTTMSFQVSAVVQPGCLVVGGVTDYGQLNYGSDSALSTSTVSTSLTGGVQLLCTPGVTLNMSVDGGQNTRHLQHTDGVHQVAYQLFSDAGLSQSLGIGQSVNVAYGNPDRISLPIYGRVVLPGDLPPGTYSDVVQVQLSW